MKKGKTTEIDLRREVLALAAGTGSLEMVVRRGKPLEFAAAVTGLPEESLRDARIEKLEVYFRESDSPRAATACAGN